MDTISALIQTISRPFNLRDGKLIFSIPLSVASNEMQKKNSERGQRIMGQEYSHNLQYLSRRYRGGTEDNGEHCEASEEES